MKTNLKERGIESINTYADRLARKFPHSEEYVTKIDVEESKRIVRHFPLFIAICVTVWFIMVLVRGNYTFAAFVVYLCLSFVVCFAVLGVIIFRKLGHGPLPNWLFFIGALLMSAIMVIYGQNTGNIHFDGVMHDLLSWFGLDLGEVAFLIVTILALASILVFTPAGVLYIISAYLGFYMPKVFNRLYKDSFTGERGKAEHFFMVPDFVDVKDVVMEPEIDYRQFNGETFAYLSTYIIIMGVLFSSYLFINPLFLDNMTSQIMLSIMMMLAMFVPALVIPWQIMRDLKAQVITDAARPYYVWNGAKHRLFSSFLTLGAFMMMFVLSLYYGYSAVNIIINYLYLLVPLVCIAVMYSAMYTNNFNNMLKVVIYSRFMERKKRFDEERIGRSLI